MNFALGVYSSESLHEIVEAHPPLPVSIEQLEYLLQPNHAALRKGSLFWLVLFLGVPLLLGVVHGLVLAYPLLNHAVLWLIKIGIQLLDEIIEGDCPALSPIEEVEQTGSYAAHVIVLIAAEGLHELRHRYAIVPIGKRLEIFLELEDLLLGYGHPLYDHHLQRLVLVC